MSVSPSAAPADDADNVYLCFLCQNVLQAPTELIPCGHMFCSTCIEPEKLRQAQLHAGTAATCPRCAGAVEGDKKPSRYFLNELERVNVRCSACSWCGTQEDMDSHPCSARVPAMPAASATTAPPAFLRQAGASSGAHYIPIEDDPYSVISPPDAPRPAVDPYNSSNSNCALGSSSPWVRCGLSQELYDQIAGIFTLFDSSERGRLSLSDLTGLFTYMNFSVDPQQIARFYKEMTQGRNNNNNNSYDGVTVDELCMWLGAHQPNPDSLGGLSVVEYNEAIMRFRNVDNNRDGLADFSQFCELCLAGDISTDVGVMQRYFAMCGGLQVGQVSMSSYLDLLGKLKRGVVPRMSR